HGASPPDGRQAPPAGRDGPAGLWGAATGREVREFVGHGGPVWRVAFRPDGRRLATASWDRSARVWDVAEGRPALIIPVADGLVDAVAFDPGGRRLGTCGREPGRPRIVAVWDAETRPGLRAPARPGPFAPAGH